MECYKFEEAGDVELLFLMEMSEETSFICDLVPLLPGVYNTSTTLPSTHIQIAALVKRNACLSINSEGILAFSKDTYPLILIIKKSKSASQQTKRTNGLP